MKHRPSRRSAPRSLPDLNRAVLPLAAAWCCAGLALGSASADAAVLSVQSVAPRAYAIAPATLADALNRFASEAGVVVVFEADQVRGLRSRGLAGRYSVSDGLVALLAGTPLEVTASPSGGYLLKRRPPKAEAAADAADKETPATPDRLPLVAVDGRMVGVDRLDRAMLRNMPAINGDVTSMLKLNPNIQFSEDALSSYTAGEIAPAEISIHGSKPYQNEILLDGLSAMNDLDPGNKITTESPAFIPGASQSLAVDSSVLCQVEVRDSNVSAEYGRFTGGVVDAKVCSARKRFGGNVSVGYTSSSWTHLFIDPEQREEFESSSTADMQPRFKKWTYKATVEARPTPNWGVLFSAVRRQSDIPLNHFSSTNEGTTESQMVTQRRVQDTLLFKTDYTEPGGDQRGDLTIVYAPSSNKYFIDDYRNSDYTIEAGGLGVAGTWESRLSPATLTNQVTLNRTRQSRRSDADYYRNWRWSTDKNWGDSAESNPTSGEGAWGDIDQTLQTLSYKFKAAFNPVALGSTSHRFMTGVELRQQSAEYERLKALNYYLTVADLPTTGNIANCLFSDGTQDTEACSVTPSYNKTVGQYFKRLMTYEPGKFEMDATTWSAFAEDQVKWRALTLRAGLRADRDTLIKTVNLAPRMSLTWQPQDKLIVDVGANRYYGRSLFAYALQEKVNTLLWTQTRAGTLTWGTATQSLPLNRLESMKSPHDDELTAALTAEPEWTGGPVSLRFTRRDGKDQVVKRVVTKQTDCNSSTCYIYTNSGRSKTLDWTLSWSSAAAVKTGPVATRLWFAFNHSDITTNYATYADNFTTDQLNDVYVKYNGQFIRTSEMPADNYNRPWTVRLGAMSSLPKQHLTITNILRVRDRYQQMLNTGEADYQGETVDVYERTSMPRSLALDTVFQWEPRVRHDQRLVVKLTVENVTNRKNKTSVSSTYASYERGRAVSLELGYDF